MIIKDTYCIVSCVYMGTLCLPLSLFTVGGNMGRKLSPERLLLSVCAHRNWNVMAISVEGMFVFEEKAKPHISVPHGDIYKGTHRACAWAHPRATPAKINTTKVIAIPIIAKPVLSVYCTVSRENARNKHSLCGIISVNQHRDLLGLMSCTYLFILFWCIKW